MQTLPNKHLTLRLVRLHQCEEWNDQSAGLSFILFKGGKGKYALREKSWNLLPGDVLVSNPDMEGELRVQHDELVFWCFSTRLEHLFPLFSAEEISLLQHVSENFRGARVYSASSPVAQECHRLVENAPPEGNVDHRSQVLRIAAAVLSAEFLSARSQRSGSARIEDHIIRVFESLAAEELLTLSVGDLANKFCCSRRHLNRLFHQHFGFSVAALRMEMRLLKAVSLLRQLDAKVISVAEQCGFNHLGLFNTCFKRRFGSSPSQWRKSASTAIPFSGIATAKRVAGTTPTNSLPSFPGNGDPARVIRAKVYQILGSTGPNAVNKDGATGPRTENGRSKDASPAHRLSA